MNYEVLKVTNGDITVESDVATIPLGITTGIVGNTYPQFIAGDSHSVEIVDYSTKTAGAIQTEVDVEVAAWLAATYPDTV